MFTEVIIALVAVALVQAFVVKPFGVPSQSMEQTLHIGDRILVNRLDDDITRGDVVVFGHGNTWQEKELPPASNVVTRALRAFGDLTGIGPSSTAYTVKRVIGLPGQKVACCSTDGKVTVDGQPLDEPYIYEDLPFTPGTLDCSSSPRSPRCFPEITVPRENLIVLGDHRSRVGRLGHRVPRRHRGAGVCPVRAEGTRRRARRAPVLAAGRHRPPPALTGRRPKQPGCAVRHAEAPAQHRLAPARPGVGQRGDQHRGPHPGLVIRPWRRRRGCVGRQRW